MTTSFRLHVFLHLFLVYISWGTTYLGFKLSLEVVGPFFACGFRMALGGMLLLMVLILSHRWQRVRLADLRHAGVYALFLVVGASGFLSYGQQYVPSGVASVITGSTPITMVLAGWLFAGEERPGFVRSLGLLGGMAGIVLLAHEQYSGAFSGGRELVGVIWILMATFGWVTGSLLLRRHPRPVTFPPLQDCGLLLLLGGLECILLGLLTGEQYTMHWERLNPFIAIAFAWMVLGGSIIAYSSYFWLLRHVSIPVAVSYEYVVPVIALFLGYTLLDEVVTKTMIIASCLAIGSVFLVMTHKHNR